jgi:glycosyltransferase involved in cell wall biosynthesis
MGIISGQTAYPKRYTPKHANRKIFLIHNKYGIPAGEEALVSNVRRLLEEKGHQVVPFFRSSEEITEMMFGKIRAFFSGMYSWSSRKAIRRILKLHKPDVAFVHNVFPLISPSVLSECHQAGVPVVMSVNNYRLICPDGLFLTKDQICEKCAGGREYWCVLHNCENAIFKSIGYALRNAVARRLRLFAGNIAIYAPMTEFQRQKLIAEGFPANRIVVIPNVAWNTNALEDHNLGSYVLHVGRVSREKGVPSLVDAAMQLPKVPFKAVGDYKRMQYLLAEIPSNFDFLGHVDEQRLNEVYVHSRFVVICSICYEGFPTVLLEAMMHSKPVICSRIGGLPGVVDDGVTGLLFEPGNAEDLAKKIQYLWDCPELCLQMGQAGREKALREYSPEKYYERLMAVYEKAIELEGDRPFSSQV